MNSEMDAMLKDANGRADRAENEAVELSKRVRALEAALAEATAGREKERAVVAERDPGCLDNDLDWVRKDRDRWQALCEENAKRMREAIRVGRNSGYDGHWETVPGQMLMALDPIVTAPAQEPEPCPAAKPEPNDCACGHNGNDHENSPDTNECRRDGCGCEGFSAWPAPEAGR